MVSHSARLTAYERLEAALGGIHHGKARCPAHDDRHPSLSVRNADGKVLLLCHRGCPTDAVLEALGWSAADLFDEPRERLAAWAPVRRVDATHPYTDEASEVLYAKVRYIPKGFAVKRPDGRGGWLWGIGPARRVLYNLPAIVAATPVVDAIWVVEGEADADALAAIGEIATCNYDGARGEWWPEYSRALAGHDVLIVADRDAEGRAHARKVDAALDGVARSRWIVEARWGKDARDHLGRGYGICDFVWWP
jgi:hypothetical protein